MNKDLKSINNQLIQHELVGQQLKDYYTKKGADKPILDLDDLARIRREIKDCYNKDFKSEQELNQLDELTSRFNNIIFLASIRHGRASELFIGLQNPISDLKKQLKPHKLVGQQLKDYYTKKGVDKPIFDLDDLARIRREIKDC